MDVLRVDVSNMGVPTAPMEPAYDTHARINMKASFEFWERGRTVCIWAKSGVRVIANGRTSVV